MKKYLTVWYKLTLNSFQTSLQTRFGASVFIIGKILRFLLTLSFILLISTKTKVIVGYNIWQMILFFATFNLIDVSAQFFFREVYRFRSQVIKGEFDYTLLSPVSPLFRGLMGGADILDLPVFILAVALVIYSAGKLGDISPLNLLSYLLLLANGFFIAVSFHIFVLGMGIITNVVDNMLWLYRDLTQMGRVPVDVYKQPLRALITFIVPVGIMMTFPSKALVGLLSIEGLIGSLVVGAVIFNLSILFWRYALKHYSSASS